MEQSYLDKVQLELDDFLQIKQLRDSLTASSQISISLPNITAFYKNDGTHTILCGTSIGNIIVMDDEMQQIKQFLTLPSLPNEEQYATFIKQNQDGYTVIGTSQGIIYDTKNLNANFKELAIMKAGDKIIDIQKFQGGLLVTQEQQISTIGGNIYLHLKIDQSDGKITQVSIDPSLKFLMISTKLKHFLYDIEQKNKTSINNDQKDTSQTALRGGCIINSQQKVIYNLSSSQLCHLQPQTLQTIQTTNYKSKKVTDLQFGLLYNLNDEALLSVNPFNCLVLINLKSNKLLTYEQLTFKNSQAISKSEREYKFFQFNPESKIITLLGQNISLQQLIITEYKVMTLKESFQQLVDKNKVKYAIKLALRYQSLQNLDILKDFCVQIFRKQQKSNFLESPSYKAFIQIVQMLEGQINSSIKDKDNVAYSNNDQTIQQEKTSTLFDDDEGFGTLEEAPQNNEHHQTLSQGSNNKSLLQTTDQTLSEVLLREKSYAIDQQKKIQEDKLARRIYKQNRKLVKSRKLQRLNHWIDNIFLQKLLIISYQNQKSILLKILTSKRFTRQDKVQMLLKKNDFYRLQRIVEKFNYQHSPYAIYLMQYKFRFVDTDLWIFKNGTLNQKYYYRIIYPTLKVAYSIARIVLKEANDLDDCDKFIQNEYLKVQRLLLGQ